MAVIIISSSSSPAFFSTMSTPLVSNMYDTQPLVPIEPPCLSKMWRTSEAVRFLLSVRHSTMTATPFTPYPS